MKKRFSNLTFGLSNLPAIKAIRRGLVYMMPLVLIGSFVTAFLNLPIPAFQSAMDAIFKQSWRTICLYIYSGTISIIGGLALITISFEYASNKRIVKSGELNEVFVVATTMAVFFLFVLQPSDTEVAMTSFNAIGLFRSIVLAILVPNVLIQLYLLYSKIRKPRSYSYNGNPLVQSAFHISIPAFVTVLLFALVKFVLDATGFGLWVGEAAMGVYLQLVLRPGLVSNLLIVLITQVLWFFGIHGGNVMMEALRAANTAGLVAEGATVVSKEFFDVYVYLGGAGATIGLLIALLIFGEITSDKRLGKSSIIPAIFNINEPLVYGLPIIMNPYFLIPFIFMPLILTLSASLFMGLGFIPAAITAEIEWTTPIFMSGYMATGSINGMVVQAFNLALSIACYAPFVILHKRSLQRQHLLEFENLTKELQYIKVVQQNEVISLNNELGTLARHLAGELELGLMDKNQMLYLVYQPKVDIGGKVIGCEALLRCAHPILGALSPMTVVSICDEAGLTNKLGRWVMRQALRDQHDFLSNEKMKDLKMSINLNPKQLAEDDQLVSYLGTELEQYNIDPTRIELELTENSMVIVDKDSRQKLRQLKEMGVEISIDDFGMGHSSLNYIQNLYASVVKLDMCLIQGIEDNSGNREIVKSILNLCRELDVFAVAEGVETQQQAEILREMDCPGYQGYYFSYPLKKEAYIEYALANGKK